MAKMESTPVNKESRIDELFGLIEKQLDTLEDKLAKVLDNRQAQGDVAEEATALESALVNVYYRLEDLNSRIRL